MPEAPLPDNTAVALHGAAIPCVSDIVMPFHCQQCAVSCVQNPSVQISCLLTTMSRGLARVGLVLVEAASVPRRRARLQLAETQSLWVGALLQTVLPALQLAT